MNNLKLIHNIKKLINKPIDFKLNYLMIIIIVSLLSVALYYSYAIFTSNQEKSGALNIIRNNLHYQLTGDNLIDNKISVSKNSTIYLPVNIKNLNSIQTKYSLCYVGDLNSGVTVDYYLGSKYHTTGKIAAYTEDINNVDVVLVIKNSSNEDVVMTFMVVGGIDDYDLIIPSNVTAISNSVTADGNIKDILLNSKINNYTLDNTDENDLYITGNNPSNYLWYSGKLWRIIKINNNSIKLITDNIISSLYYHNNQAVSFSSSYASTWLNNTFYNSLRDRENYVTDTSFSTVITDTDSEPSQSNMFTSKVGLLNRYEYAKLSYLGNNNNFWLINPTTSGLQAYVKEDNKVSSIDATSGLGIRPVISLKSSLNIKGGIGTKTNPYRLENDNDLFADLKGVKINSRYSGEYVKFNNQLFRIANILDNTTKIVSVNTVGESMKFSETEANYLYNEHSNTFDYLNNTWYNSLSLSEKSMLVEGSFSTGLVTVGGSYLSANEGTIKAKVGLPIVGELFTGYIGSDNKTYFTMTPNTNNTINRINSNGILANSLVTSGEYYVKVSVYLKENAIIVGGDGTLANPFTFEENAKEITSSTALSTLMGDETRLGSGRHLSFEDEIFIIGENPNNYLWYSGKLWRVVSIITKTISEENQEDRYEKQIKLITDDVLTVLPSYHTDYSTDFATSHAYHWLNEEFYSTLRNPNYYLALTYSYNATLSPNNSKPDQTTMINSKVGLLNRFEYYKLITDTDPLKSYLKTKSSWWLISPYSSSDINYITSSGQIDHSRGTIEKGIRPVIVLKGDLLVVSGAGSYSKPYRLEGDNDKPEKLADTKINTRYSGEYVVFNDTLYRIVKVENNLTKLVSLEIESDAKYSFASDNNWLNSFSGNHSGNYLNNTWYNSLDQNSKDLIVSNTWYLGIIKKGESYRCTVNSCTSGEVKTINKKIGLLRSGELFNSYLGTNNKIDNRFWTLTATENNQVKSIGSDNSVLDESFNTKHGLRSSFYLKENTTIKSGDGTQDNPFILNT